MPIIDQVIQMTITLATKAPTQAGFGTPLLLGYHTLWPVTRVKAYSDPDDMLTEGFSTSHPLYLAAKAVCSQSPRPPTFKIGRRATPLTQTIEIVPTITKQGFVYSGTINGKALTYTNGASETVATICTALAAAITALSAGVTPTGSATKVSIAAPAGSYVQMWFGTGLDVTDVTADVTTDAEFAACEAEDGDWYGALVVDSQSKATDLLFASWLETKRRIGLIQSADAAVLDGASTTDVASALQAATYKNCAVLYHRLIAGSEYAGAAWLSRILSADPGSATPAWKSLSGVSVDTLQTAQSNAILAKNASAYVSEMGVNFTFEGKTPSGQFLDTTRAGHWLYARMQERLVQLFASADIVPFTDSGIQLVVTAMKSILDLATTNGILSPDVPYTVSYPKAASVSVANRANRRLPDIKIAAQLAGAIHGVVPVNILISV